LLGEPVTPADTSTLAAPAAMAIFAGLFALATLRGVHLGILMFSGACAVGVTLAGMPLSDVVGGFPVGILVLVAGVTYFFGIAHVNGTTERVMRALLAATGATRRAVPLIFFVLAGGTAAMGSPQAGLVTGPIGMPLARRARVDSALMAIAINSGISAGAFAPTSLFGIVTYRIAREAGIDVNRLTLLGIAVAAHLVLLAGAFVMFAGTPVGRQDDDRGIPAGGAHADVPTDGRAPLEPIHVITIVCMAVLVLAIVGSALMELEPDIGAIALGLGAVLALIDPVRGTHALARIDWSTAFVVGGIVTFVGVLQKLGSVDLLGTAAMDIGMPFVAALVVCMIAAVVSAFASTTAVLAALVPLAVPLATSGHVAGWALVTALGVSATVVDVSPFSNTGATLLACSPEEERPRLRAVLMRWGLSMIVLGPFVLVPVLMALSRP
jgi:di/tricarboxylate transporter